MCRRICWGRYFTYHKLSTLVPFTPLVHNFHSVRQILIELNYGCGDIVVIVIMMCVCTIIHSYCWQLSHLLKSHHTHVPNPESMIDFLAWVVSSWILIIKRYSNTTTLLLRRTTPRLEFQFHLLLEVQRLVGFAAIGLVVVGGLYGTGTEPSIALGGMLISHLLDLGRWPSSDPSNDVCRYLGTADG